MKSSAPIEEKSTQNPTSASFEKINTSSEDESEEGDDLDDSKTGTTNMTNGTTGGSTTTNASTYTLTQVSTHNSSTSCWTTISGAVYNLTDWIAQHPGGEGAILSICGKDGTSAFMGQHGDGGRAAKMLTTFKIGTLK
jgi:cytochrome b involved in lipid metabolism